jgi:hypothetical protein
MNSMKIRSIALAIVLPLLSGNAYSQSDGISTSNDANHFLYWLWTGHLANYTEWWYFNLYDSSNKVQAIFSYLITDPLSLQGGVFPLGISEMAAVAYTPTGIVNEMDAYLALSFSAQYNEADVHIGNQNAIAVIDPETYKVSGATRDGRIVWNLVYRREAPSWYAGNLVNVSADPWQLMSWLLYMPRAHVSGTLTVDGTTYNVSAPGYHDHNWGEWNLNGVSWNWAQYSQPGLTFDLGDFPQKPGGVASLGVNGERFVFESGQYSLIHTQWAYDPTNNLLYPTQSVFHASDGAAEVDVTMNVLQSDPLAAPVFPPRAVIYEQTVTYTGHAWVRGKHINFTGNGFKEYTGISQ